METLTALISSLVLAGVSGITALAFKHPRAFAKLYPFLNLSISIVFLALTIWEVAVHVTWTGVSAFVAAEQLPAASSARAALNLPYVWICLAYAALLVFLWINLKLPVFIRNASSNANGD